MNLDRLLKPGGSGLWLTAAPWGTLKAMEGSDGPVVRISRQAAMVTANVSGRAPMLVPGVSLRVSATAQAATERFVP